MDKSQSNLVFVDHRTPPFARRPALEDRLLDWGLPVLWIATAAAIAVAVVWG